MGRAMAAREEGKSYEHLRIFEDVVSLISNNYVEDVDIDKVMHGAMHGLADGLDPDTAYLDAKQVGQLEANEPLASGQTGIELTRQYYLRVIAARDGSPAARAGLQPGDYIRAIDGQSTRDTSVFEGTRLLRGKPGTKVRLTVLRGNAADPHDVELTREELPALAVKGRIAAPGTGYLRVAEFSTATADQCRRRSQPCRRPARPAWWWTCAAPRSATSRQGSTSARLFVPSGTLAYPAGPRQGEGGRRRRAARSGGVTLPTLVLTDNGTAGAAELFAGALQGNKRADDRRRADPRPGRAPEAREAAGRQRPAAHPPALPRSPVGGAIHEKGLVPDVAVEQPTVDFGQTAADRRSDAREGASRGRAPRRRPR